MKELYLDPGFEDDLESALGWLKRNAQRGLDEALEQEIRAGLLAIQKSPTQHHFDVTGCRRYNLRQFSYSILFEEHLLGIFVFALRHDSQSPRHGEKRLP